MKISFEEESDLDSKITEDVVAGKIYREYSINNKKKFNDHARLARDKMRK